MVSFSGEGLTDSRAQGPRRILREAGGGPGGGKWDKAARRPQSVLITGQA